MIKVDLHVHSKFSNHPSEWFLQKIGASESYTQPIDIYKRNSELGLNAFTITDHNCIQGAIALKEMYPDKTFISVESTVYFPEDGGKVHILFYGITPEQFAEIQELRHDIYRLRDYIKGNNIAYSVAHATYSVNGTLKVSHLEKLILLFDVFEVINGGRGRRSNDEWREFLINLQKEDIEILYEKYRIEPYSDTSWLKGFTAGSDDHAGLFLGKTYTFSNADTVEGFLDDLRNKKTYVKGRHNNFQGLAFAIYKIAYDFTKYGKNNISKSLISQLNSFIFEDKKMGIKDKLKMIRLKGEKKKGKRIKGLLGELLEELVEKGKKDSEEKINIVYDKASEIVDEFFRLVVKGVRKDLKKGNIYNVFRDISSSFTGIFLTVPFITTFKHMFDNRDIVNKLEKEIYKEATRKDKKVLWFTDTLLDLNGVSVTLKKIGNFAAKHGKILNIATGILEDDDLTGLPPNIMSLDVIDSFELPYYENYKMRLPSFLSSLKKVYEFDPDEIYVSTPGPIGLLGVLIAKLLNLKCTGIYHTDFTLQSKQITDNSSLVTMLENYSKWFYSLMDEVKVPTQEYINILRKRNFNIKNYSVFDRGIETDVFFPRKENKKTNDINLLYTGRISKDKNLIFLIELFQKLKKENGKLNLELVGDGPDLQEMMKKYSSLEGLKFRGRVNNSELPEIYRSSDIFVFPSTTDTFGMSVLEAQSSGVPSIVSNVGGPKEIIVNEKTGFSLEINESGWYDTIMDMVQKIETSSEVYERMRIDAYEMVNTRFSWDNVLSKIFD